LLARGRACEFRISARNAVEDMRLLVLKPCAKSGDGGSSSMPWSGPGSKVLIYYTSVCTRVRWFEASCVLALINWSWAILAPKFTFIPTSVGGGPSKARLSVPQGAQRLFGPCCPGWRSFEALNVVRRRSKGTFSTGLMHQHQNPSLPLLALHQTRPHSPAITPNSDSRKRKVRPGAAAKRQTHPTHGSRAP